MIIDLVWSYKYGRITELNPSQILKLVEDNFVFHSLLIHTYFSSSTVSKKLILVTSSAVNKINANQDIYNALKTGLSNLIKSVNKWFEWTKNLIIEFQPWSFKSEIYKKADSLISQETYATFEEPIYYAKKLVELIFSEIKTQ